MIISWGLHSNNIYYILFEWLSIITFVSLNSDYSVCIACAALAKWITHCQMLGVPLAGWSEVCRLPDVGRQVLAFNGCLG